MAEGRKKKTSSAASAATNGEGEAQKARPLTSGEILRAARMQKGLGLEEISSSIHIRVTQLRAIEEGNLSALPGMTYALGFVKSYASYLKLNSADIVQKFKAEHGGAPVSSQPLHMPEPLAEGPQPNLVMIGVGVFFAVIVLGAWAIFSGGDESKSAEIAAVPPAPVVGNVTGITPPAPPQQTLAGSNILGGGAAPATPAQPEAVQPPAEEQAAAPAEEAPPVIAAEAPAPETAAAVPAARETVRVLLPVKPDRSPRAPAAQAEAPKDGGETVIKIKRGKGRIVLSPTQSAWVEIRDKKGDSVLKQVLRPGDQYYVPDQPGLTLLTTNAGGLDVYVDGAKVQSLGKPGEIVRGVDLNPDELKISRIKARDRR